jgi:streptogramin lyase
MRKRRFRQAAGRPGHRLELVIGLGCLVTVAASLLVPSPPAQSAVRTLLSPSTAYVNPFSITDVSPDAAYDTPGSTDGMDPAGKITSLALDQPPPPCDTCIAPPPTLWAGTQYDGVWRSTDGARTWHQASFGIRFGVSPARDCQGGCNFLAFDGSDSQHPQRLLFVTSDTDSRRTPAFGGLYVSVDGADSWQHVDLLKAVGGSCQVGEEVHISSVAFSGGRPFVASACGIFTTADAALDSGWTALPAPPFPSANSVLAGDSASTLFACNPNDSSGGLYESQDLGQTWTPTNAPLSGTRNCRALSTDPLNGKSASRTVFEVSDYSPCPSAPPLPATCNYEVSEVVFSNTAGASDQRSLLGLPSDNNSGCCGQPYVFAALRADRPQNGLDQPGISYDIYAADQFHFYVYSGLATSLYGPQWTKITGISNNPPFQVHVDTWAAAASPNFYAPSFNACDVWLADDGGIYQNFSAQSSAEGPCTPGSGWGRAMAGLHAFDSTSISGAPRPQSECAVKTDPCPALYVASGDNDTWATAQARPGADWGIMDDTLGDSGSSSLDPSMPYQLMTGREGGGGCHLAHYYSSAGPQTPPLPGDNVNLQQGDRGSYSCFDPPHPSFGGLEPPGNAAFSQVRRIPTDFGNYGDYITVDSDPATGDAIVERLFTGSSDSGWFQVDPAHRFAPGQVAAIKTSGGQTHTVIYVLTQSDGNGYAKGHVYRGTEDAPGCLLTCNNFAWTDVSGSPSATTHVDNARVLFADPYNPQDLFVVDGTDQTIKESFDGGQDWQVDSQLTDIAYGHGNFTYACNVDPGQTSVLANGCLLKDMSFVPGYPNIRIASTLPGGIAFSRDYGHDWIDLDLTNSATSMLGLIDPQPIQSPAGTFYDPTLNPRTGEPSLYVALRGAGVERVDGPFTTLGGIEYTVQCQACRTLTVFDDTSGKFAPLARYPDGLFRTTELLNLSGITTLSYHFVVDGVATGEETAGLSSDERDSGVVPIDQACTTGPSAECVRAATGLPQAPPEITEFQVPPPAAFPQGITEGPDAAMWFGLIQHSSIARVDANGHVTEFPLPDPDAGPVNITTGPDGNLWFAERGNFCGSGNRIGRLTPLGKLREFALPTPCSEPYDITAGPDDALWFTELHNNAIGRISVTGRITEYPLPSGSPGPGTQGPEDLTLGPDSALWFTELAGNKIGRISSAGVFTEFPVPTPRAGLSGIVAGSDGNLWFTEFFANKIGRITPKGIVTEYPIPTANSQPPAITSGPVSGVLWFTEFNSSQIGRITTDGVISEAPTPTTGSGPAGIAMGPRGSIWFTEVNPDKVATFSDR